MGGKKASALELDGIEKRAVEDVGKAVEFGEASPNPELDSLFDHVYAEEY